MFEDFRQFIKFYHIYKKGTKEMDKAKQWIMDHKQELTCAALSMMMFKLGYNRGWKDYRKVVNNVFKAMNRNGYNFVKLIKPEGM